MLHKILTFFGCCQKPTRPKSAAGKFHILLDIDRTLANAHTQESPEFMPWYQYAAHKHLFLNAHYMHTLHPGVIELIQYLISHPRVYASSLFSFCDKIRNQPFAKELYQRALGEGFAEYHPAEVFNIEHMKTYRYSDTELQHHQFDFPIKNYYSPERKALAHLSQIDNIDLCILIEDNNYSIAPGEEKNALLTSGADISDFVCVHQAMEAGAALDDTIKKSILRVNHIFYITGLLHRALQETDPTQFLFALQFEPRSLNQFHWRNELSFEMLDIYRDGLDELQKMNPALQFLGGKLAQACFGISAITADTDQSYSIPAPNSF